MKRFEITQKYNYLNDYLFIRMPFDQKGKFTSWYHRLIAIMLYLSANTSDTSFNRFIICGNRNAHLDWSLCFLDSWSSCMLFDPNNMQYIFLINPKIKVFFEECIIDIHIWWIDWLYLQEEMINRVIVQVRTNKPVRLTQQCCVCCDREILVLNP